MFKFIVNFALPGLCIRRKLPNGQPFLQRPSHLIHLFRKRLHAQFYPDQEFQGSIQVILNTEPGVHNNLNGMVISLDSNKPACTIYATLERSSDRDLPANASILSVLSVDPGFAIDRDIAPSFSCYCRLILTQNSSYPPLTELTRSLIVPFSVDLEQFFHLINISALKNSYVEEVECREIDTGPLSTHWSGYESVKVVEIRLKCFRTVLEEDSLVPLFTSIFRDSHESMKNLIVPPCSIHLLGYERSESEKQNCQIIGQTCSSTLNIQGNHITTQR